MSKSNKFPIYPTEVLVGFLQNFVISLIPLEIGIPQGFITPTEKSNFGRFGLGKINPMGIEIPLGIK